MSFKFLPGTLTGRLNARDRDRANRSPEEKKTVGQNSGPHLVVAEERGERALGLRTASGSTLGGARTQVRARTTRERGRAGAWASGRAASRVRIRQRPLQGQLERATRYARSAGPARMGQRGCRWCDQHTHTYTHIQAQAFVGLDRLFVDF